MTKDKHGRRAKPKRQSSIQWPWSRHGWMTDEYYAGRDRELDAKVEKAGKGLLPYGYYEDRPGLAITAVSHNPYLSLPFVPLFIWFGFFIVEKNSSVPFVAFAWAIFLGFGSLFILIVSLFRIPGWHRARKVAREHVREHGGQFPRELRWWQ
ncbi:MAG: hypothetical protein ACOH1M_05980 [Rhodoglobus sp.]